MRAMRCPGVSRDWTVPTGLWLGRLLRWQYRAGAEGRHPLTRTMAIAAKERQRLPSAPLQGRWALCFSSRDPAGARILAHHCSTLSKSEGPNFLAGWAGLGERGPRRPDGLYVSAGGAGRELGAFEVRHGSVESRRLWKIIERA